MKNKKLYYMQFKEGTNILWALFQDNDLIDQGTEIENGHLNKAEINELAEKKGLEVIHIKNQLKITLEQKRKLLLSSDEWKDYFSIV